MIVVCSHCRREIRRVKATNFSEDQVSHGICEACLVRFYPEVEAGENEEARLED